MRPMLLLVGLLLGQVGAAQAEPRLTLSRYQIHAGEMITLWASGFAPEVKIVSHLFRPDGTEYPVMTFATDVRGEVMHTITIVPIAFGTYEVRMIEEESTASGSTRFMMVAPGWPEAGTVSQTASVPEALAGVWRGTVEQEGGGGSSPALVTLSGGLVGTVVGTVAYPARACGGELWLVEAEDNAVRLGEVITYGAERCTGHGIVTLASPDTGGAVSFTWRDAGQQDAVVAATGVLRRRSEPQTSGPAAGGPER